MSEPTAQPPPMVRRGLRRLVAAHGLSSAGDGAFLAAAPLAAAAVTRDPAAVAAVAAAEYLPWVLIAPLAGVYVDRWPKRSTMVIADLVRAVTVAGLAVLVATGTASVVVIAACASVMVAGVVFHSAAAEAVVADLAGRDSPTLHSTNGALQTAYTGGRQLAGPPIGSLGFAWIPWLPFAVDAASFVASAGLVKRVPHANRHGPRLPLWASLREGVVFLVGHATLRTLALLVGAANLAANMASAVLVLYATDAGGLAMPDAAYGLLLVAMAVGGIVGAAVTPRLLNRLTSATVIAASLAAEGIGLGLLAATSNPWIAGIALAIEFVGVSGIGIVVAIMRQRATPPAMLGRTVAAFRVIGNGPAPLGAVIGGFLALSSLRVPIIVAALVLAASAVIAGIWAKLARQ